MTADTIIKVRACPNKVYAIAYWARKNQVLDWYKNKYIQLLLDGFDEYRIMKEIRNMDYDDEEKDE